MPRMRLNRAGDPVPADTPRHRDPARSWRNTAAWKRASARQIARQPWCTDCRHTGSPDNPLTCDHVVPVAAGGAIWDRMNHTTRCRRCNSSKGASF